MPSLRNPMLRYMGVALGLVNGKSAEQACRDAGYSRQTARKRAFEIVRRPGVKQALLSLGNELAKEYKNPNIAAFLDKDAELDSLVQAVRVLADLPLHAAPSRRLFPAKTQINDAVSFVPELERRRTIRLPCTSRLTGW